jgi:Neuraminidase (sialidase)
MNAKQVNGALARLFTTGLLFTATICLQNPTRADQPSGVERVRLLPPGPNNPRNSEGDFILLADGRILFVYSRFTGGAGDHAAADLAGRFSDDGGKTWTEKDETIVANEGQWNVMSVSLLRLADGRIGLFYARKNSLTDCRPLMRTSTDEAKTWSEPVICIDQIGYYVLNNDRAVQLSGGRIVLPVALHNRPGWEKPEWEGQIICYFSDDAGHTWRQSRDVLLGKSDTGARVLVQEPGVVELKDRRLMMFCRTNAGSQWVSYSSDGGDTWSALHPSNIVSPVSPASIERIPATGDLLLVWNDHQNVDDAHRGKRTPLTVAVSRDEGQSWQHTKTLEENPHGWYCYTAIQCVGRHVLLGHCAGDRRENNGLAETQITRFSLDWLYE